MALAPVLSEAITATPVPRRSLFIGGGPNVLSSGVAGSFGVQVDTIEVEEAGPGGVSSMTFLVDDPAVAVTIADGQDVRYWDNVNLFPIFQGWVQAWNYVEDFGGQGRTIKVTAIGPEALLDWCIVPTLSIAAGQTVQSAIQAAASAAIGTGPLRWGADPLNVGGVRATPIGLLALSTPTVATALTLTAITLREAIRTIVDADVGTSGSSVPAYFTVDMYFGLRAFPTQGVAKPTDWDTLTLTNTPVGAVVSENIRHEVNAAEIIRGVYVVGGNAAGTGLVPDGTGKVGPIATFSNSAILTAADMQLAGAAYLAQFAIGVRGSFDLTDQAPDYFVHAGVQLFVTDARMPDVGTSPVLVIASITKTYNAVRENWTYQYGGLAPSAMRSIRRLTRSTLS